MWIGPAPVYNWSMPKQEICHKPHGTLSARVPSHGPRQTHYMGPGDDPLRNAFAFHFSTISAQEVDKSTKGMGPRLVDGGRNEPHLRDCSKLDFSA